MAVYTRAAWGARAPKSTTRLVVDNVDTCFVHYSTGEELGVSDCAQWVRNIQDYHMDDKGWSDIAYNFLVCRHGDIFVGRGWIHQGAATYAHNSHSWAVCFLGDDDSGYKDVREPARAAIKGLIEEGARRFPQKYIRPHSAVRDTACPGDELRRWISNGLPLREEDQMNAAQEKKLDEALARLARIEKKVETANHRLGVLRRSVRKVAHWFHIPVKHDDKIPPKVQA